MDCLSVREVFKNRDLYSEKSITVCGWVRNNRPSKVFGFIMLNDGTYFDSIQIVYDDKLPNFSEVGKMNVGTAVIVNGTLVPTPEAQQPFEIHAKEIVL